MAFCVPQYLPQYRHRLQLPRLRLRPVSASAHYCYTKHEQEAFPFSAIPQTSRHRKTIHKALSDAMEKGDNTELQPGCSSTADDMLFWISAFKNVGMELNRDICKQLFPKTNESFAKLFFEMAECHIADHALPVNLLKEKVFSAKDFKEKHYAMNLLKTSLFIPCNTTMGPIMLPIRRLSKLA
jgi:hypothetical protein